MSSIENVISSPSSSDAIDVATSVPSITASSVIVRADVTSSFKASFTVIISLGLTSAVACEVCPLVEFAVTVNAGRFPPPFTNAAPAVVKITSPESASIV